MLWIVGCFPASSSSSQWAPSNTGVEMKVAGAVTGRVLVSVPRTDGTPTDEPLLPQPQRAAHPRWASSTCPTFIRLGTPSGLRMTSTGVPSARNGMSSTGRILEMTPLLP